MYVHITEYIDCLNAIAGGNWFQTDPATLLVRGEDRKLVQAVLERKATSNGTLAAFLYGKDSGISARYRRRVALAAVSLSKVVAICSLSETLDSRKENAILCLRNACIGQILVRTAAQQSARLHLLEANRRIVHPELVSFAPPVLFALAYYEASDGLPSLARQRLRDAIQAAEHARVITELSALWIELSIPVKHASLVKKQQAVIHRAESMLSQTMRKPMTGLIAVAASRLATSVAQLTNNVKLGLRWLERSKNALIAEQRFTPELKREYHAQRLFLYGLDGDYENCSIEADLVAQLCEAGSVHWFKAKYNLQKFQLEAGEFDKALVTGSLLSNTNRFSRQPAFDIAHTKVRNLYATVLSPTTNVTQRLLQGVRGRPVDKILLRVLITLRTETYNSAVTAVEALRAHCKSKKFLTDDRALWLLTRLLFTYAHREFDYAKCKKLAAFERYEAELLSTKPGFSDSTIVSPSLILQGIMRRNKRR